MTPAEATPAPGDLIFGNRRSLLRRLSKLARDPWVHVGLVVETGDGLHVAEMGYRGFQTRSLEEFVAAYLQVGLARPELCYSCRHQVTTWVLGQRQENPAFSWPQLVAIGLVSMARAFDGRLLPLATAKCFLATSSLWGPYPLVCSTLVARALAQACAGCRPPVGLRWGKRQFEARRMKLDRHDYLLISPSDLWRIPEFRRWESSLPASSSQIPFNDPPTESTPNLFTPF